MESKDFILAVMSASDGAKHTPVQIQKLFFLIDKKISKAVGGPYFKFKPYDYGPFDSTVYDDLRALAESGDVEILNNSGVRKYKLTDQGEEKGKALLNDFHKEIRGYIKKLSEWVRSLSFGELVSAIYSEYPAMKKYSVFRG